MCTSGDMRTSGLAAAILDLSLPVRLDSIVGITQGLNPCSKYSRSLGLALALAIHTMALAFALAS